MSNQSNKNIVFSLAATLVFNCLIFIGVSSHAAPIPTATSKLVEPKLGIFRSPMGFQISSGDSGWSHAEAPKHNKYVATVYEAPSKKKNKATLTVRVDKLEKDLPVDKYVQRWMKEYPKYGFDVLGSKPFTQNKHKGYVMDLINRDSKKQLRQVVFVNKKKAVILTCRDQSANFKSSLKGCNQIIRTFAWLD